jgi:hypothetical protein
MNIFGFASVFLVAFFSNSILAADLPNRIYCQEPNSKYQLVLVFKDPSLPANVRAIALKKDKIVVFKVAATLYTVAGENNTLNLIEFPVTETSKEVKLHLDTKVATLANFHLNELADGSLFNCKM